MTQEARREALEEHVDFVHEVLNDIIRDLDKLLELNTNTLDIGIKVMLHKAYTLRYEVIDKHPANNPRTSLQYPYKISLVKEFGGKLDAALALYPDVIPDMFLDRWKRNEV